MNTLLSNTAIIVALASLLGMFGGLIGAAANWLNARARMMEMSYKIEVLQTQQAHLATAQQVSAALAAQVAPPPTILQLPPPYTLPALPAPASPIEAAAPVTPQSSALPGPAS